jgi:hypothetical protein
MLSELDIFLSNFPDYNFYDAEDGKQKAGWYREDEKEFLNFINSAGDIMKHVTYSYLEQYGRLGSIRALFYGIEGEFLDDKRYAQRVWVH